MRYTITKKLGFVLAVILVLMFVFTSCLSSNTPPKDTQVSDTDPSTGDESVTTQETTEATTPDAATEETTGSQSTESNIEIYDPSTLPLKYAQTNVCAEPSLSGYSSFASSAKADLIVPGLDAGFIPQGMDYWADRGWLLISCYNSDTSVNSVLFAVDVETGKLMAEYYFRNADGSVYNGHAGGIAVTEKNLYISSDGALHRIPLEDLDAAKQCGYICIKESIAVPVRASFCNYSGGVLWVGDFHHESAGYTTDGFRHMVNRNGKLYKAWTVGYVLDESTENEFKASALVNGSYATPDYILSMTDKIQGMTYVPEKGKIVLSQSYGRTNDSAIYSYNDPRSETAHTTVKLNSVSVPVWFLDEKVLDKKYSALPMSEGIANVNGKVYILFESGAEKYRLGGGKLPTDMVYTLELSK